MPAALTTNNTKEEQQPPQKGLNGEAGEKDPGPADGRSSRSQSIDEIPYEDMISVHSVNAFVPLILCRELLPLMGTAGDLPSSQQKPEELGPRSADTDTTPQ